ncbi:MAG: hypothetical protein HYU33_01040 [Candidatus Omnitrophica bacterium]|nr:hypothetical protein [Candidatus Omnitrophota bacterium]
MKYLIVRCEDKVSANAHPLSLLEGAKVTHLQNLAQGGAAGLIRFRQDTVGIDRLRIHRGLLGIKAAEPDAAPGHCYAASANVMVAAEETVWCCELVTQRDGQIVDPTAGGITTRESEVLIQALEDQLGSETRRWEVGKGSHHLFIVTDPTLNSDGAAIKPPNLLLGQLWENHLPHGTLGESLHLLIQESAKVLDAHPINRVRVDLGENPANLLWLWGAAVPASQQTFKQRTGLSAAIVSRGFYLKGAAKVLGLDWTETPYSTDEAAFDQLDKMIRQLMDRHDLVYVQYRVEAADHVERLCAMERLDRMLRTLATEHLPSLGPWRLLTVIDHNQSAAIPFVAIGTGLTRQPVASLSMQHLSQSPLVFDEPAKLFDWLIQKEPAVSI